MDTSPHKRESEYRTRWLMAHNRLHAILHSNEPLNADDRAQQFEDYLAELRTAEDVCKRPA